MNLRILSGTANPSLAAAVARELGIQVTPCKVERFPDGELRPTVGSVRDDDVYVVQSTGPPVNDHLVELLLLLDACQRGGAGRITAVMPYMGYGRQDRRKAPGDSVGAHVAARTIALCGTSRVIVVDPHSASVETMFDVPVERLTAVPVLAGALHGAIPEDAVVVSPDLGAVKLAEHYGELLDRKAAIVRKTRQSGSEVQAEEVIGEVAGKPAIIVDDMITTGSTVVAAARALLERGARRGVVVAATHGVLVQPDIDELATLPTTRLLVTDSLTPPDASPVPLEVVSIAPLLADAISRLHWQRPLDDLMSRT